MSEPTRGRFLQIPLLAMLPVLLAGCESNEKRDDGTDDSDVDDAGRVPVNGAPLPPRVARQLSELESIIGAYCERYARCGGSVSAEECVEDRTDYLAGYLAVLSDECIRLGIAFVDCYMGSTFCTVDDYGNPVLYSNDDCYEESDAYNMACDDDE